MSKKYPEPTGPQTETELFAWLFGMLAAAYNMLDQYERDDKTHDEETERQRISDAMSGVRKRQEGKD